MDYKIINNLKVFYRKDTSDELVIKEIFEDRIFEKGFPEYRAKRDHIIIDVGAHIGVYSMILSQQINKGILYAFEPCADTFTYLNKNIKINKIHNIKSYKIALNNNIGTTKLFYDIENGNWGHSIVKKFSTEGEMVETDTLSHFFLTNNIQKCDLIKFNCEGAEFKILLTTPVAELKKINHMLVLYHMDLTEDYSIEQLIAHLKKASFYTEIRQKSFDGKRGWLIVIKASKIKKVVLEVKSKLQKKKILMESKLRILKRRIINAAKGI
jgi:FkbM family methyltransferase